MSNSLCLILEFNVFKFSYRYDKVFTYKVILMYIVIRAVNVRYKIIYL